MPLGLLREAAPPCPSAAPAAPVPTRGPRYQAVALRALGSACSPCAAHRLGQAQAVRPEVVGRALAEIQREPEVAQALFRLLEISATLKGSGKIILTEASTGLILNS